MFREAYRKHKKILKSGYDIVIVVRKDLKGMLSYDFAKTIFLKLSRETDIVA